MSFEMIPEAVREYLSAYKYKIELHAHTSPASVCSDLQPEKFVELIKSKNYDAVTVTNHFYSGGAFMRDPEPIKRYLDDYYKTREIAEKVGIKVYLGAEFRFDECINDYLVFGVDEEFLTETSRDFSLSFTEFYDKYKRDDILIVQAHPFRNNMTLQPPDKMDGIEAFNCHPSHNSRVCRASSYATEEGIPIITLGTDLHHVGHEGSCALRSKTLPEDGKELVRLLRSRDYLFEIGGRALLPYCVFD